MPESVRFHCPECDAGIKAPKLPKQVTCPRCGHKFAPQAETADGGYALEAPDPVAPPSPPPVRTETPPPSRQDAPRGRPLRERSATQDPEPQAGDRRAPDRPRKKKRKGQIPDPHKYFWAYVGGGVAGVAVVVLLLNFLFTPRTVTPEEVAGTYTSDKGELHLGLDRSIHGMVRDDKEGALAFMGSYKTQGRTVEIVLSEESEKRAIMDLERARGGVTTLKDVNFEKLARRMLGHLSFRDGAIVSENLGRFVRKKEEGAVAKAPAERGKAQAATEFGKDKADRGDLAADGSLAVTANGEGTVFVWEPRTGRQVAGWATQYDRAQMALSPRGSRLFVLTRVLRVLDPRTGQYLDDAAKGEEPPVLGQMFGAWGFTPDERTFFLTDGRTGFIIDGVSGKLRKSFQVYDGNFKMQEGIHSCVLTPDGRSCLAVSLIRGPVQMKDRMEPKFLQWWNLETGKLDRSIDLPDSVNTSMRVSPAMSHDGKTLALFHRGTQEGFELRDVATGDVLGEIRVQMSFLDALFFSKDDKSLIAIGSVYRNPGGDQRVLWEWDVATRKTVRVLDKVDKDHWGSCRVAAPAGLVMYHSFGPKGEPRFVDLATGKGLGEEGKSFELAKAEELPDAKPETPTDNNKSAPPANP
jgi:hypothetical protein